MLSYVKEEVRQAFVCGNGLGYFTNSVLSQREQVPHNMIAVCRIRGLAAQQAFDTVGELLTTCYRRWDELEAVLMTRNSAQKQIPWLEDAELRDQVMQYLQGIKNVVRANLYWRLVSSFSPSCAEFLDLQSNFPLHLVSSRSVTLAARESQ